MRSKKATNSARSCAVNAPSTAVSASPRWKKKTRGRSKARSGGRSAATSVEASHRNVVRTSRKSDRPSTPSDKREREENGQRDVEDGHGGAPSAARDKEVERERAHAEQQQQRVGAQVAGLDSAREGRAGAHHPGRSAHERALHEEPLDGSSPEEPQRPPRADERAVVELVEVPLV